MGGICGREAGGVKADAERAPLTRRVEMLPGPLGMLYPAFMTDPAPLIDNEETGETRALAAAIAKSDADPRTATHDEVRAWLLRLAEGEFDAPAPEPR